MCWEKYQTRILQLKHRLSIVVTLCRLKNLYRELQVQCMKRSHKYTWLQVRWMRVQIRFPAERRLWPRVLQNRPVRFRNSRPLLLRFREKLRTLLNGRSMQTNRSQWLAGSCKKVRRKCKSLFRQWEKLSRLLMLYRALLKPLMI